MSDNTSQVRRLFEYHHWAGNEVFAVLSDLSAAELDKPWGGSFGTGRKLLRHVVGVEFLWDDRLNGGTPTALPEYPETFAGKDFRAELEKAQKLQTKYLARLETDRLGMAFSWKTLKGDPMTAPLGDVLTHVVNHGTYHRGQLTHLLRDLGRSAPSTDYVAWATAPR